MVDIATLQLDRLWLNLMSTGESVAAFSGPDRPQSHEMQGEVRTYAGGRQRSVAAEGERSQFAFTLRELTLPTIEKLRSWKGQAVEVRDHRGQRFFGVFHSVTPIEWKVPTLYDAAIVVRAVTTDEGV